MKGDRRKGDYIKESVYIMLTLATFSACWWLHKMFFLILVCAFYSTKKLIGEVIGNIKFEDEKAD